MKDEIRAWFTTHEHGNGDFFPYPSGYPYSVVPPRPDAQFVVYCTKTTFLQNLMHDLEGKQPFGAIMRGGLPADDDIDWLCSQVGTRRLLFLGDADPADLLTFAWLRESLPMEYVGLSECLLQKCGVEIQDRLSIPLVDNEIAALPLVTKCLGDLDDYIGPGCSQLLSSGYKVELEALYSFAKCTREALAAALLP
ncbi:hypothetical protein [Aeoliella mucimassa]|uniref:Uncharacterized protein n=1 Tax=Aeoliella mucimassa TaxID=2527972 RepID=A0A518AJ18_9BACT|nr:hypothetical protein [Aeoliella mucimassa]QDU54690.1 hypothetical protein Pan181_08730 [Aeoliella mucimassa]